MKQCVYRAVFAAALLIGPPAHAGFLRNSVEIFAVKSADESLGVDVVGAQVEYDPFFDFIDIADTTIALGNNTLNCVGSFVRYRELAFRGNFFGFKIVDHLNSIAPFAGVDIASSTIAGFSVGDIEFSKNEIFLRFERLGSFALGNIIPPGEAILNVTFLPEPGSLTLFCAGLAGIVLARRRRGPR